MVWKRITYAALCIAAIIAYILTDSPIALFALVGLVVFPLVSFLLLAFAVKRVNFACEMRESCIRGGALQITMKVGLSPRFSAGSVLLTAEIENATFHKNENKQILFRDLSFTPHTYEYVSADAGKICVRIRSLQVIDFFGIFSLRKKCSYFSEASVSPMLYEDIRVRVGVNENDSPFGEISLPKKGGDVSEILNVRDYIPGDALNAVHWKLTGKFGALKSKEFGSTDDNRLLILVDMSRNKFDNVATDAHLNATLDVAASVSHALKSNGYTHRVGWVEDGFLNCCEVSDGNSFVEMIYKLMSVKVSENNAETIFYLSRSELSASFTKLVFITTAVQTDELRVCGATDVTAIVVGDMVGEMKEGSIRIIDVPGKNVHEALSMFVL